MLQTRQRVLCRHCESAMVVRPRGLCSRCYACRQVRRQYRPLTRNRPDVFLRERRLPRRPTTALPGSAAKLRVLQARFSQRVQLFHPLDA